MKTKPYTAEEFFHIIMDIVRKENLDCDILDYAISSSENNQALIDSTDFSIRAAMVPGSSEGVYGEISIQGYTSNGIRYDIYLGTLKTLCTDRDTMRKLGSILADFVRLGTDFVNDNIDDFTFSGYKIVYYRDNGRLLAKYSSDKRWNNPEEMLSSDAEQKKAKTYKHHKVEVSDMKKRTTKVYNI